MKELLFGASVIAVLCAVIAVLYRWKERSEKAASAESARREKELQERLRAERQSERNRRIELLQSQFVKLTEVCKRYATKVTPRSVKDIASDWATVEAQISELLGAEETKREQLGARRAAIANELLFVELDHEFLRLNPDFLTLRQWSKDETPVPLFAVFDINAAKCSLAYYFDHGSGACSCVFVPANMAEYFYLPGFAAEAAERYSCTACNYCAGMKPAASYGLAAPFNASVTDRVRDAIHSAQDKFDEIFLVTDEPNWTRGAANQPEPEPRTPLVIGKKRGCFWVILDV